MHLMSESFLCFHIGYLKFAMMVILSPGSSVPLFGETENSSLLMTSSSCLSISSSCPVSAQYSGSRCMSMGNLKALYSNTNKIHLSLDYSIYNSKLYKYSTTNTVCTSLYNNNSVNRGPLYTEQYLYIHTQ